MTIFEDLLEYKMLTITSKMPKWFKDEDCEIITSEHEFFERNYVVLFTETRKSRFVSSYVKAIRRKFKCEWFLTIQREDKDLPPLLVGKLPWKHYVLFAPIKLKEDEE